MKQLAIGGDDNNNNLVTTARTQMALCVQQQQNVSLTAPTYYREFLRSCANARTHDPGGWPCLF
jgi:hypothetical protein